MELLILNGLVNGLIVGGIYALVGVSLTLLYGVLRWSFRTRRFGSRLGPPSSVLDLRRAPLLAVPIAAVASSLPAGASIRAVPRLARSDDPS